MNVHPIHLPSRIRRDEAITAGFDPHRDDFLEPAAHLRPGEGVDVMTVWAAEVKAIRATFDTKET